MPIDWFTVVAQIINFLILVWLLKKFLYKPILNAIDDREKRIATQLAEAKANSVDAQRERDDFREKNQEFEQQSAELLKDATDAAKMERQKLLEQARADADALRVTRQIALENERQKLSSEIKCWTQKEVFEIARKTLLDLADVKLEERIGEIFVQRLRSMGGLDKEIFLAALKASTGSVCVRSSFELSPSLQHEIRTALKEVFDTDARLTFGIAPEIISGVELSVSGQKICWSIADYLTTLEKRLGEAIYPETVANTDSRKQTAPEKVSRGHQNNGYDGQLEPTSLATKDAQ